MEGLSNDGFLFQDRTMRTKIKICGITRREDLDYVAACGADAAGLVFQPSSPRCLSSEAACSLLKTRPPFLSIVALFMDAPADAVRLVLDRVDVDYLQFHGSETADYCRDFGKPYIKTIPLGSVTDVHAYAEPYRSSASAFLFDSNKAGSCGGSGKRFDWSLIAPQRGDLPLMLAGGLTADNVAEGIARLRPLAVDVASGVESAQGIKDKKKIDAFFDAVYHAA